MAKSKKKQIAKKKSAPKVAKKHSVPKLQAKAAAEKASRLSKVIEQAKEPFSLLETLKEEGMARAGYLLGVAAEMASGVTKEGVLSQIQDLSGVVGFASSEDVKKLRRRIEELEERIEGLEAGLNAAAKPAPKSAKLAKAARILRDEDGEAEDAGMVEEEASFDENSEEEFRVKENLSELSEEEEEEEDAETDPDELN